MFPSETAILMDIARNKDSGKQLANRAMDVVSEYIGYLCDSLVRRGYITGNRTKGYQLTSMGRGTLLEFFKENEGRVKDMISRPRQLGSEYGHRPCLLRGLMTSLLIAHYYGRTDIKRKARNSKYKINKGGRKC